MKDEDEKIFIKKRKEQLENDRHFFSKETVQIIREKSILSAYLRLMGIQFSSDEIELSKIEPPDLIFRKANFEITEFLSQGRKRTEEIKDKLKQIEHAESSDEILLSGEKSTVTSPSELLSLVVDYLKEGKALKYSGRNLNMSNIDYLVYVNKKIHLYPVDECVRTINIPFECRSISVLIEPYAILVYGALPFKLSNSVGVPSNMWKDLDTLWRLE